MGTNGSKSVAILCWLALRLKTRNTTSLYICKMASGMIPTDVCTGKYISRPGNPFSSHSKRINWVQFVHQINTGIVCTYGHHT